NTIRTANVKYLGRNSYNRMHVTIAAPLGCETRYYSRTKLHQNIPRISLYFTIRVYTTLHPRDFTTDQSFSLKKKATKN
ncbi:hypothetical protein NPIL_266341, partial [Nephila pilipes]